MNTEELSEREGKQFREFGRKVQDLTAEDSIHARCLKYKQKMLTASPILTFLLQELEKVGHKFDVDTIKCTPCNPERAGGFVPGKGIVLCENQISSKPHLEDTLAHELIHAYDHSTVHLNWNNPLHLACTEIRGKIQCTQLHSTC